MMHEVREPTQENAVEEQLSRGILLDGGKEVINHKGWPKIWKSTIPQMKERHAEYWRAIRESTTYTGMDDFRDITPRTWKLNLVSRKPDTPEGIYNTLRKGGIRSEWKELWVNPDISEIQARHLVQKILEKKGKKPETDCESDEI